MYPEAVAHQQHERGVLQHQKRQSYRRCVSYRHASCFNNSNEQSGVLLQDPSYDTLLSTSRFLAQHRDHVLLPVAAQYNEDKKLPTQQRPAPEGVSNHTGHDLHRKFPWIVADRYTSTVECVLQISYSIMVDTYCSSFPVACDPYGIGPSHLPAAPEDGMNA